MSSRRHVRPWRLSHARRPVVRLLAAVGLSAALLAPGVAAAAAVLSPLAAHSVESAAPGVLNAAPATPKPPPGGSNEPAPPWTGLTKIHVEDGHLQDWQGMLVAAGGATLLMFLVGKVRKK